MKQSEINYDKIDKMLRTIILQSKIKIKFLNMSYIVS